MIKNFFTFLLELVKIVVISLVIIIPVRQFLIQPFYVKGASMEPNFHDHEYLIIDELSYNLGAPKRGDIVVFRYPKDPQEFFIKRVIGLPGETVRIADGNVYIINSVNPQGVLLEEPYLPAGLKTYGYSDDETTELKSSEYFVLGDNRGSSKDSRSFGPVNESFLVGRVLLRGFPFDKIKLFNRGEAYNL